MYYQKSVVGTRNSIINLFSMSEQGHGGRDHFLALSIIVASFIIGGSLIYGAGARSGDAGGFAAQVAGTNERQENAPLRTNNPTADDDVILGDPDAPVTIIEFGDFQCPFCAKLHREVSPTIREKYIATGKAKMVYRDFPLDQLHPEARGSAEAAQCAGEQGSYWLYHDALFARQTQLGNALYSSLARELGLNGDAFDTCLTSGKYRDEVEKDYQDGVAAGVQGTPATFVNGTLISGAVPLAQFEAAIEAALAETQK